MAGVLANSGNTGAGEMLLVTNTRGRVAMHDLQRGRRRGCPARASNKRARPPSAKAGGYSRAQLRDIRAVKRLASARHCANLDNSAGAAGGRQRHRGLLYLRSAPAGHLSRTQSWRHNEVLDDGKRSRRQWSERPATYLAWPAAKCCLALVSAAGALRRGDEVIVAALTSTARAMMANGRQH